MMPLQDKTSASDERSARLTAVGAALQAAESLVPYPIPGVKLGLANVANIWALENLAFSRAFLVSVCRPVAASFLNGTFLSPTFIISFIASPAGFLAMAVSHRLKVFSAYGVSVSGAIAHNAAQLAVVYFLFIRAPGMFGLAPALALAGVISGLATGALASRVLAASRRNNAYGREVAADDEVRPHPCSEISERVSWGRLLAAAAVIAGSFFADGLAPLAAADVFLAVAVFLRRQKGTAARYARFAPALTVFSVLPVLFGGGITVGAVSGLRILLVFQVSVLLFKKNKTASLPELKWRPFKIFPLTLFARAWNITGRAVALAPDALAAFADVRPSASGVRAGFFERVADALSGATQ
ncbi:MAG: Gx transporter family protein [Endomicrobiia bacterium]|nr:Gx transporter family protein [Endomicrobiia bacterium]